MFLHWVLCRQRDEHGKLVKYDPDLPRWVTDNLNARGEWVIRNPRPYGVMLKQVLQQRGLDEDQSKHAWEEWRANNPDYGRGGED